MRLNMGFNDKGHVGRRFGIGGIGILGHHFLHGWCKADSCLIQSIYIHLGGVYVIREVDSFDTFFAMLLV